MSATENQADDPTMLADAFGDDQGQDVQSLLASVPAREAAPVTPTVPDEDDADTPSQETAPADAGTETGTQDTTGDGRTDGEPAETVDAGPIDYTREENIPEELRPMWRGMQGLLTRTQQELRAKEAALGEGARLIETLRDRIPDIDIAGLAEQLNDALAGQEGEPFAAPATIPQAPTTPDASSIPDPETVLANDPDYSEIVETLNSEGYSTEAERLALVAAKRSIEKDARDDYDRQRQTAEWNAYQTQQQTLAVEQQRNSELTRLKTEDPEFSPYLAKRPDAAAAILAYSRRYGVPVSDAAWKILGPDIRDDLRAKAVLARREGTIKGRTTRDAAVQSSIPAGTTARNAERDEITMDDIGRGDDHVLRKLQSMGIIR